MAFPDRAFQRFLEAIPDAALAVAVDGTIAHANSQAERLFGYPAGELAGRPHDLLVPEPSRSSHGQGLASFFADSGQRPMAAGLEVAGLRADGSEFPAECFLSPLEAEGGPYALAVVRDLTEARSAVLALRRRSLGLATLLEVSRGLTATLDPSRVLQAAVEGATALVGTGTAAVYLLEGESVRLEATTPPLPPNFPEDLRRAALAVHPRLQEAVASGRPVFLPDTAAADLTPAERAVVELRDLRSILYLPLVAGVEPVGVLIVASTGAPRDITEEDVDLCCTLANLVALTVANARLHEAVQRHAAALEREIDERNRAEKEQEALQAQLAHAQKMEAVGRLAGGVAHDFNNMLAVILGRAELALLRAHPEGALRQDLVEILQAADRSAVLTRRLLAFARRQAVTPQVLDLTRAVGGMLQMLRRLIGEDVDLVWAPGDGLWDVYLDPSQLDQVLANLVVNARDAIAGTGRITLGARNVALEETSMQPGEAFAPGEYVLLTVADDGCGMDEETLAHLFEPFFTTKAPGQGTGLGLATVYGIVRQGGGFLDVESEPGRGTTVRVYLPRAGETAQVQEGSPGALPPGQGETVLLVEDEEAILTLGREMLERLGYVVLAAGRPSEALRLAEAHPGAIHLLLTDVVMPEMNGRELAERLTGARPELRCLFLSGYTADVIAHRGVLEQGIRLLEKPFTVRELAAKVREALEGPPGLRGRGGG